MLNIKHMRPEALGIKRLHRELPAIIKATKKGKSFLVFNRTTPVFRIEPVAVKKKKKFSLADIKQLSISTRRSTLSRDIDNIVYSL